MKSNNAPPTCAIHPRLKEVMVFLHQLDKIGMIAEYKDLSKCRYHCPILSMIITGEEPKKQIQEFESTKSDITKPVFIYMDNEEIEKKLNNLETKIKNKKHLMNPEILDFGIIAIFTKDNEILESLCKLYNDSKYIKGKIRSDMALILDTMIKTRFKGNIEKIKELINMIEEEIEAAKRGMRIWYEEEFAIIEADHAKQINEKKAEYAKQINEKEAEYAKQINEKEAEHAKQINEKEAEHAKELAEKNREISQKENQISRKDNKIKELEDQRQHYKDKIDELKEKGKIDLETYNEINSVFE